MEKMMMNPESMEKMMMNPESTEKIMMNLESTEKKMNPEMTEKKNRNWNRRGFGAPSVWYDGVPTAKMNAAAELAIDVYNDTHVMKYRFVELKKVIGQRITAIITFTAKPQENDNNLLIFRARVNTVYKSVVFNQVVPY
ncbi:hypothetical protein ABFS83_05G133300 [Erythranthe nasuta]